MCVPFAVHNHYRNGLRALKTFKVLPEESGGARSNCRHGTFGFLQKGERGRHCSAVGVSRRIDSVWIDAPRAGNFLGYPRKSYYRSLRKGAAANIGHYEPSASRIGGQASKSFALFRRMSRWCVDYEQGMRIGGIEVCRCPHVVMEAVARRESVGGTCCARLVVAIASANSGCIREAGDQGPLRRF